MKESGERGSLTIAPKVVERIAEFASREIPGTSRTGGGFSSAIGRKYPRIGAEVAGDRAVVDVEIAAVWPVPVPVLADEVARKIRAQLSRCAGVQVDRINVTVGHVARPSGPIGKRVQ